MNTIELAEYLYAKGHLNVLLNKGIDIEKILLGYNKKPVNINELVRIAKQEGFIFTDNGVWVSTRPNKLKLVIDNHAIYQS